MRLLILPCILLLAGVGYGQAKHTASVPEEQRRYCAEAAEFAKENPDDALYFSAVAQNRDPARDKWHRVPSSEALKSASAEKNSTAVVSIHGNSPQLVDFVFQNQFGDSEEFAQYCYRPDGTLANIHSDLKSYHAGRELVRDIWFDHSGSKLVSDSQAYDLQTHKPAKLPADFWDLLPPEFLRVSDLPFAAEMANGHAGHP